jgi:hypothetical protein
VRAQPSELGAAELPARPLGDFTFKSDLDNLVPANHCDDGTTAVSDALFDPHASTIPLKICPRDGSRPDQIKRPPTSAPGAAATTQSRDQSQQLYDFAVLNGFIDARYEPARSSERAGATSIRASAGESRRLGLG